MLDTLDVLVGEWSMVPSFGPDPAQAPRARTTFEWLPGKRFLIQRWQVDHPDAPDGIAIVGADESGDGLLQHYFDSRGVARVYAMRFDGRVWTLERHGTPPDFSQRFTGNVDGKTIAGRWEIDRGSGWSHDFDLSYTRVG